MQIFRRLLFIALAGALAGTVAARTLEIVEGAYEAVLAEVSFPGSTVGTLIFRMCGSCEPRAMQVDSATVYVGADGRQQSLPEFLAGVADLRAAGGDQASAVGIFFSLETNRVTRVRLFAGILGRSP